MYKEKITEKNTNFKKIKLYFRIILTSLFLDKNYQKIIEKKANSIHLFKNDKLERLIPSFVQKILNKTPLDNSLMNNEQFGLIC